MDSLSTSSGSFSLDIEKYSVVPSGILQMLASFDEASALSAKRQREKDTRTAVAGVFVKRPRAVVMQPSLQKIISGGQTGADRGALEAAISLGIQTAGWAPPGFATSAGKDPLLATRFHLREIASSGSRTQMGAAYVMRSKQNVDESDATLALRIRSSTGTDKTIGYCHSGVWKLVSLSVVENSTSLHRPILIISDSLQTSMGDGSLQLSNPPPSWHCDAQRLHAFLIKFGIHSLNVCGHRQESFDPGWQLRVTNFLRFALAYCGDSKRLL